MIVAVRARSTGTLLARAGVLVGLLCLIIGSARADDQRIVFQSTDTPPYWSASLPDGGLGGSMLKLLSDNAGLQYAINYLPTKRFRDTDAPFIVGDPDLLIDQKPRAIFPIGVFHTAFFYYKPHHATMALRSFKDLRGFTLGVLRGTLEDRAFFVMNGVKIEEGNSPESLLRMLKRGRIDVCILVAGTGRETIQKLFPQEKSLFEQSVIPKLTRPLTIMIDMTSPEDRVIAGRYQQVLDSTLHSPQYRQILEKYYGSDDLPVDQIEALSRFIKQYADTWKY